MANGSDGISLGAGIGQASTTGGNPLSGYTTDGGRYTDAHYVVGYQNSPNFYDPKNPPADPKISMQIGTKQLAVNLDTGSRGLYFDELQLDSDILNRGTVLSSPAMSS